MGDGVFVVSVHELLYLSNSFFGVFVALGFV
jgi:hypothetical protein